MIYIVMAKSATGKDTVFARLINDCELSLKRLVPYTTRPIRNGEKDGIEYHFTNEETFDDLLASGKVAEYRKYNTVYGVWTYYTVDDNDDVRGTAKYILIGTLEVYDKLRLYYGENNVKPIYIEVNDYERLRRAMERECRQEVKKFDEVCRRYLADEIDFSEEKLRELGISKRYYNYNIDKCVEDIKKDILSQ